MTDRQNTDVIDFYLSRAGADNEVALIVAKILRDAGHTTFLQDEDFGHTSFMQKLEETRKTVDSGARLITLLSRPYMSSDYCMAEAGYSLIRDPSNHKQRLIVFRVEECQPTGLLKTIPYVDLVPLMNDAAGFAKAVLGAVDPNAHPKEASFAALYRRSGKQILHPEVRAVPGFTARETELAGLETALWNKGGRAAVTDTKANTDAAAVAVKGMGGVGKSVLAQQYAWVNRERYQGVWWIRAEEEETLLDDLIELGIRLIDKSIGEIQDRKQAGLSVLDEIAQRQWDKPWLLVYDNVESPDKIANLTPANGAHVLITTRWSDWYGHAEELPVDVFPRETAIEYLLERARGGDDQLEQTREEAGLLADDLGCLPLALAIARAQAWKMNWTLAQYRKHFAEMLSRDPGKEVDYPRSVFATFTLALDQVIDEDPEAEQLLNISAFLAPDRIPVSMLSLEFEDSLSLGDSITLLSEKSLIETEVLLNNSPAISVHRLVQAVLRERLRETGHFNEFLSRSMSLVTAALESSDFVHRQGATREPIIFHALRLVEHALGSDQVNVELGKLSNVLATEFLDRGEYSEAEPLLRHALSFVEQGLGATHNITAVVLNNLAELLRATSRLSEAEPLMRRALEIDEASFGPDNPNVAIRLNNLAQLLQDTNRLSEAEPLMRRALEISEASFGPDHPDVAIRLNNLAQLLQATNRPSEAEPLMRRVIEIFEKALGPDHPNVATSLNNLAQLLKATNRLSEAEPLYRRANGILEQSLGAEHPQVATGLNNLALLLQATNRLSEAEPLMRRALAIDEASLGPDHPKVAIRLNNLAGLLQATNRLSEAEPLYHRAVAIGETSLGPDHPNTLTFRNNLAALEAEMRAANGEPPHTATEPLAAEPATEPPSSPPAGRQWFKFPWSK